MNPKTIVPALAAAGALATTAALAQDDSLNNDLRRLMTRTFTAFETGL